MLTHSGSTKLWLKCLVGLYTLFNKSGILRIGIIRKWFERAYFGYKRLAGDPYLNLLKTHPQYVAEGHVFDIGANIGYTVGIFARFIGPTYKVFAFEPEKHNFHSLDGRFKDCPQVETVFSAVGERQGEVDLWENDTHHADHRVVTEALSPLIEKSSSYKVSVTSIDSFLESRAITPDQVAFVKIDVQGYEIPVLKGLVKTLRLNPRIVISLEFDKLALTQMGFDPTDLLDCLDEMKGETYLLKRNGQLIAVDRAYLLSDAVQSHVDLVIVES